MSSTLPASRLNSVGAPVWLACHDAGAANLAIAWLDDYVGDVRASMAGPADALWRRAYPGRPVMTLEAACEGAGLLLSGSGWASTFEHDARRMARRRGIRSVAVLDHWVNYRERFVRDGELVLPDEIWVGDADAAARARDLFPGVEVCQWRNRYLERHVGEVAALGPVLPRNPPLEILYVLEPIREPWSAGDAAGEFQALGYFLDHLPQLGVDSAATIRLRSHPSEPPDKYADWPARYPEIRLLIDNDPSLSRQIARADWVVGCQTNALVVALAAGRIAMTTLPPWAPPCPLPQSGLRHMARMMGAGTA